MDTSRRNDNSFRVVVLGYIVRGPLGGLAWHHLQYVLGLARLGHDVYFVEDSDDFPSCYDPSRDAVDADPTYGLRFIQEAFTRIGLPDRWAYHDALQGIWHGPLASVFADQKLQADLLLNVSAANPVRDWMLSIPNRVMIDTDPVFTQIRHLTDVAARARAELHTAFFTFGENYGTDRATIPMDGLAWRPTRQPIVLDAWPVRPAPCDGRFTTVMQWDSYSAATFGGRRFGMKSDSFTPYLALPSRVVPGVELELAIGGSTAVWDRLSGCGWRIRNPLDVTLDPWTYQRYIQESRAEFTVAKHGYVVSRSGWFSERSAAYLASGRPVVTQETGFSDWLRSDRGVLSFETPEEAVDAIAELHGHYEAHRQVAREVAKQYFEAAVVLPRLLDQALAASAGK